MHRWNWDRIAAAMGVAFVALFVATFVTFGERPKLGDSPEEVASYFADDRTRSILFGLATLPFVWFVGAIATTLRNAGDLIWVLAASWAFMQRVTAEAPRPAAAAV